TQEQFFVDRNRNLALSFSWCNGHKHAKLKAACPIYTPCLYPHIDEFLARELRRLKNRLPVENQVKSRLCFSYFVNGWKGLAYESDDHRSGYWGNENCGR